MKRRDLVRKLLAAGYQESRNDAGHAIYEKQGARPVQVPNHREINENTANAILKAAGLKLELSGKEKQLHSTNEGGINSGLRLSCHFSC